MDNLACESSDDSRKWGVLELLRWKSLPARLGGGIPYIQSFKDAWVRHNKIHIRGAALRHSFPVELLAGVCWIEVAGDPSLVDRVAFEVRAFDWSGPDWVDRSLTVTHPPQRTSFGSVSIQLRTAAEALGMDPRKTDIEQLRTLARCLEQDTFNIDIVARHLRQIIDRDGLQAAPPALSAEAIRVAGARYNRGIGLSLAQIKSNTSYGDFILRHRTRFLSLMR